MLKQITITLTVPEFELLIRECVRAELNARNKEPPKQETEFIPAKIASGILKVSLPTLRKLVREGHLKSYRVGHTIRFKREEVEQCLRSIPSIKYSRQIS